MADTQIIPAQIALNGQDRVRDLWLRRFNGHTRRAYTFDLASFEGYLRHRFRISDLTSITPFEIQEWVDHLNSLPLRPGTRHRRMAALKSFFSFACNMRFLELNPTVAVRMPSAKDALNERILDAAEVHRLIAAAAPGRYRLIVRLLYYCGLRISELLSFGPHQIRRRADGGQITVIGKGNKTRTVLVPPGLFDDLSRFVQAGAAQLNGACADGGLFAVSASQVNRVIKIAAEKAGIKKPVSAHWLRHCNASHALDRGCPLSVVQSSLGHASVATTSRYLHARPDQSTSKYLPEEI